MSQLLSVESTGADIESAIAKGIQELGVSREQVIVEVLEEPVRRLLGLGVKPARVRLTVIRAPETPAPAAEVASFEDEDGEEGAELISEQQSAEAAQVSKAVLRRLLQAMGIRATIRAQPAQQQSGEPQHWTLDVRGAGLSELIGRRGETLAALQYITRLITSRQLGRRAYLVVDVNGYKARREVILRRLALRMAEQAIQSGRTVSMEPMPPHERRIVHLALKDNPNVSTESVGEGDDRRVTIVPRRQQQS
ncbi:MAG: protein jag [Chloroflexi bacterium]|jgi:spoIIIJ-associated protein|nr:protein jag [Chloroflexota bacterium]